MTMPQARRALLAIAAAGLLSAAAPSQREPARASAGTAALTALDYIEIQQLVRKYAWAIDSGDDYGYAYADLFTPGGVLVGTNQRPATGSITGRDALAAIARGRTLGATHQRTFVMNHVITPSAGGATGRAYVVVIDVGIAGSPNGVEHGGHYDDVYEHTPVGWRFTRRTYYESKADVRPPAPAGATR